MTRPNERSRWFAERLFLPSKMALRRRGSKSRKQIKDELDRDVEAFLASGKRVNEIKGASEESFQRVSD